MRSTLTGRGVAFALARVKQDLLDDLQGYGLVDSIGAERLFPTLATALAAYGAVCRRWRRHTRLLRTAPTAWSPGGSKRSCGHREIRPSSHSFGSWIISRRYLSKVGSEVSSERTSAG